MTHHVFLLSLKGELCATKLKDPKRILDLGTGTGIWVSFALSTFGPLASY